MYLKSEMVEGNIKLSFPAHFYNKNKLYLGVPQDEAGEIVRVNDESTAEQWQFIAPDNTKGPIRKRAYAAKHDALAYWSDKT